MSQFMRPSYTLGRLGESVQCSACGCLVTDESAHDGFHEALARLLDTVAED